MLVMPRPNRALVVAVTAVLGVGLAGCSSGADPAASPAPSRDPSPTVTAVADLPASPMILFEWYPAGGDTKTVIVTDEGATVGAVQIVPDAAGNAVHAAWAPSGEEFAWEVLGDPEGSVWTAKADGSGANETVTCEADPCVQMSFPAYSPDGTRMLVTRYDIDDSGTWSSSHLVIVDLATVDQSVVASTADGSTSFYSGSWSPDGTRIAAQLETYPDDEQEEITSSVIVVVDVDPATPDAPVAVTDPALFAGYPRWHPTDDLVLFASWDLDAFHAGEDSQLYTVASDGSGLAQITHVGPDDGRPGEATWTPDGKRIIASIGIVIDDVVQDVKVAWIDPATGEIEQLSQSGAMPTLQPTDAS